MKISTDNGTVRNVLGDMKALELIAEAGFDGIDYTFYDTEPRFDVLALPQEERYAMAMRIKEAADGYGLAFPQSHAPYAYQYGEDENGKNYQDVLKSLEFSAWLGCRQVVIHTLKFPRSKFSEQQSDDVNREFLRGFLPLAEKLDLYIGVENLFQPDHKRRCFIGEHETPEKMNAFVDSLESPRFCVCCDLGHAAITGTEPERFIAGMDPARMTMLHVHDTDYLDDSHTIPFLGLHNWEKITEALAREGFAGYMNLEVLHFYERFPADLLPDALRMAAAAARSLADRVELAAAR